MFKLFVFAAFVAVATAKPGYLASPLISTLVGEKTIESHGNAVVHASAPVIRTIATAPIIETVAAAPIVKTLPITYAAAPAQVVYNAAPAYIAEKTISSHGQHIIHNSPAIIPYTQVW